MMDATSEGNGENLKREQRTLEQDVSDLREDVSRLVEQLGKTGQHSYGAARRAAAMGADQLRTQTDAAIGQLRSNAEDIEEQLIETVREKPITSLAIAAGVGFLFALVAWR